MNFPGSTTIYRQRRLPESGIPAGYSALIEAFELSVVLPRRLFAIGERHQIVDDAGWRLLTPRHAPAATVEGHLIFALKYEGIDLGVLKSLFETIASERVEAIVEATPSGSYARRLWFLYEWLTGQLLDLDDAERGNYVDVVDSSLQFAVPGELSRRHRVRDNLPGTPVFCPMVFRTDTLVEFEAMELEQSAREAIDDVPGDLLTRTAAFLLLDDSRASYAIEGERPPQDRIQRWGRAIGQAGRHPLDLDELLRLQKIVIGDARFVKLGLRKEEGFVGERDRRTRAPIPSHISARPDDLAELMDGLIAFARGPTEHLPPMVAAAALAFGFVYIHPFYDGNGRLHRYLIHHVLSRHGIHPPGLIFPISSAILERIDEYRRVLESHSSPVLELIDWRATADGNVEVLNDTADYYRFFDATPHAEFLYACMRQTIEEDLPRETEFLRRYDEFRHRLELVVDMPDSTQDLLFRFLDQHEGHLSKRARTREFAALTDDEVTRVEEIYGELF